MKLFQIKTPPLGSGVIADFLQDNFVCIGLAGIGDLENIGREELRELLIRAEVSQGQSLEDLLESLDIFVHTMQDGDYILVADEQWVYLGDLGDYFYDEAFDNAKDGSCHRRGVTWLKSVPRMALNSKLTEWLAEDKMVSKYMGALPGARLDLWITDLAEDGEGLGGNRVKVDEETLADALAILKDALHCEDAERRERAAIAILQFAK